MRAALSGFEDTLTTADVYQLIFGKLSPVLPGEHVFVRVLASGWVGSASGTDPEASVEHVQAPSRRVWLDWKIT